MSAPHSKEPKEPTSAASNAGDTKMGEPKTGEAKPDDPKAGELKAEDPKTAPNESSSSAGEPKVGMAERATRLAAAGAVGASVVHELRNALAVVSSSLFLAQRDRHDEERLLRHLAKATEEVRHAHAVVSAVLGLARGEALAREPTLVAGLVSAARSAVVLPTNVTFSIAIHPSDLSLSGDPVLLERLLSNLYLNAIEALAGRGLGSIQTRARLVEGMLEIEVDDDGPGFDPALVGSLFDPLVTTKEGGTGLGLALVRAVAEAHGGDVTAERIHASGGSRFRVRLPV